MVNEERKYIGGICYARRYSKAELVRIEDDMSVPLTPAEYKILSFFIDNINNPITLDDLARHLWGIHSDEKDKENLKPQISRVRRKLEEIRVGLGSCIDTNYGFNSYTMRVTDEQAGAKNDDANINVSISTNHVDIAFALTSVHNKETIVLRNGLTLVGKDRIKCNCVFDNPKISSMHATIYIKPTGLVTIQDMNSINGTYLNQRRLPPMVEFPVQINDCLRFADEEFLLSKITRLENDDYNPCPVSNKSTITLLLIKNMLFGSEANWAGQITNSPLLHNVRTISLQPPDNRAFLKAILPEPVLQLILEEKSSNRDVIDKIVEGGCPDSIKLEICRSFTSDSGLRFRELRKKCKSLLMPPANLSAFYFNVNFLFDHLDNKYINHLRNCYQRCTDSGNAYSGLACLVFFALVGEEMFSQVICNESDYVFFVDTM